VNVVLAMGCGVLLATLRVPQSLAMPWENSGFVQQLMWVNVVLAVFNMTPAFPMDGGRVLRAVLALGLGQQRATRIAAAIGQVIAGAFVIGGILQGELYLAFIGVFVFLGASQEARSRPAGRPSPDTTRERR